MALVVMVVLLAGALALMWALQRQLIYFPDAADVPPASDVLPGARDVTLSTSDGLELGAGNQLGHRLIDSRADGTVPVKVEPRPSRQKQPDRQRNAECENSAC